MSESEAASPQILPIHSAADMRLTCGFSNLPLLQNLQLPRRHLRFGGHLVATLVVTNDYRKLVRRRHGHQVHQQIAQMQMQHRPMGMQPLEHRPRNRRGGQDLPHPRRQDAKAGGASSPNVSLRDFIASFIRHKEDSGAIEPFTARGYRAETCIVYRHLGSVRLTELSIPGTSS